MHLSIAATESRLPLALSGRFRAVPWRRLSVPLAILLVWQGCASLGLTQPQTMPAPADVVTSFWSLIVTGQLWPNLLMSLQRVVLGLILGVGLGMLFGLLAGLSAAAEDAIDPTLQMARTLPHLALIPLMILWFGIDETPKVLLIALGALFPIYLNLFSAIRGVDRKLVEVGKTLGLSRAASIAHIILPSAVPSFLVGLRQSLGLAWISLVVAEQINAQSGIGYLVMNARDFLRTDIIFDGLIIYALLGLATDLLVRRLEARLLEWRPQLIRSGGGV